jgi:hypothetical protein
MEVMVFAFLRASAFTETAPEQAGKLADVGQAADTIAVASRLMRAIDVGLRHEAQVRRRHQVVPEARRDMHHLVGRASKLIEHVFEGLKARLVRACFLGGVDGVELGLEMRYARRNQVDHRVRQDHQGDVRCDRLQNLDDVRMRLPRGNGVVQRGGVRWPVVHAVRLAGPPDRVLHDLEEGLPLAHDFVEAIGPKAVQKGRHPAGRNAIFEQALSGRAHLEVDERAVAVEADEFGFEGHRQIHWLGWL